MSVYDLHFNKDDVTIRNIIIGLLATMHDNIYWYNQIGSEIKEKRQIKVPFYFSTTGTERYLQDNFLNNIDFDPENLKAETFYNAIPRGIVDFTGISIESSAIVNKYVRMFHQKQEDDGTLNTYNTEAYWVPIILNIDCKVYCDSILDQLKCTESIIKTFFKSKAYQVDLAYTRIPCLIQFPEDYTNERSVEFSFTDKREFTTSFSLQVKSYIPIFKEETSIFAGNTMEGFSSNVIIPVGSTSTAVAAATAAANNASNSNSSTNNVNGGTLNNNTNNASPGVASGSSTNPNIPDTGLQGNTDSTVTGGSDLSGNNGTQNPTSNPDQTNSSEGIPPNKPSWPYYPTTTFPPQGGTPNIDPSDRF